MYKRILVPLDFTPANREALDRAHALLADGGELILLHVIEAIPHLDEKEDRDFYDRLRSVAEHKIVRWTSAARKDGVHYRDLIELGKRAPEIVRVATDESADLIVMNSHRPNPKNPQIRMGTTSHWVAVWANCPVMLLKMNA